MSRAVPTTERGQAMVEYTLLVSMLALFVFVPNPVLRHPDSGEPMSLFFLFVEAFDIYINSFHTVITLPIP